MMVRWILAFALIGFATAPALADRTPAPEGAEVYIVSPADGAVVKNPVTVVFGLRNAGIAPAGIEAANTGHHHLLIDTTPEEIDFGSPLPANELIRHFGGGQTEASVDLPSGDRTLRLLLGDHNHIPHDPPVISGPITITVE